MKGTESRGASANFTPKDTALKLKEGFWQESGIQIAPLLTWWTQSILGGGGGGQGTITAIDNLSPPKQ